MDHILLVMNPLMYPSTKKCPMQLPGSGSHCKYYVNVDKTERLKAS